MMKKARASAGVLLIFLLHTAFGSTPDQDRHALEGKWRAIEATSNGQPPPPGMLEKLTLVFRDNTISVMGAPPTRFTLDTNLTPSRIDILNSRHQVGIYELKDDILKLCIGMDGDRPKAFHTEPGTDHTFMRLKRIKE
jgi:uncharacterized protein (TIGR03067 family)